MDVGEHLSGDSENNVTIGARPKDAQLSPLPVICEAVLEIQCTTV